jgi:hypothetical protein
MCAQQKVLASRIVQPPRVGQRQGTLSGVAFFERAQESPSPAVATVERGCRELVLLYAVHAPEAFAEPNETPRL